MNNLHQIISKLSHPLLSKMGSKLMMMKFYLNIIIKKLFFFYKVGYKNDLIDFFIST